MNIINDMLLKSLKNIRIFWSCTNRGTVIEEIDRMIIALEQMKITHTICSLLNEKLVKLKEKAMQTNLYKMFFRALSAICQNYKTENI